MVSKPPADNEWTLIMLRNHLMTLLAEKDNDTVTVDVNGILIDVDAVTVDRGCIVLVLNPEDMQTRYAECPSQTVQKRRVRGPPGMPVHREPPPPGLVAAAEQDYHYLQNELANLISKARELMAARHTEVEAVPDLWLTLLWQDPRRVALLGATAVVQLAKAGNG